MRYSRYAATASSYRLTEWYTRATLNNASRRSRAYLGSVAAAAASRKYLAAESIRVAYTVESVWNFAALVFLSAESGSSRLTNRLAMYTNPIGSA